MESSKIHHDHYHYHVIISLTPHHEHQDDHEQIYKIHDQENEEYIDFIRLDYDEEYKIQCSKIDEKLSDISRLTCTMKEKFKFNKAIIVNSTYLHYPSNGKFGSSLEDGRLVEIYSINVISSIPRFHNYRFLWYFDNIFSKADIIFLHKTAESHCTSYIPLILSYKDSIVTKCLKVYVSYIIDNTPELLCLFNQVKTKLASPRIDVSLSLNMLKEGANISWRCNTISNSTFTAILHLNDNDTGLSVLDHFTNEIALIPARANSLCIFPNSWLYPMRQTTVFKGVKSFIMFNISLDYT
jgi:hypothetical protein